mmetsp:Transcript_38442/g.89924  ORF Transcript_38442/g.89924 Transcript_38442/m.89924 type:complete len:212 (+) Transcript_38442:249-884(+)
MDGVDVDRIPPYLLPREQPLGRRLAGHQPRLRLAGCRLRLRLVGRQDCRLRLVGHRLAERQCRLRLAGCRLRLLLMGRQDCRLRLVGHRLAGWQDRRLRLVGHHLAGRQPRLRLADRPLPSQPRLLLPALEPRSLPFRAAKSPPPSELQFSETQGLARERCVACWTQNQKQRRMVPPPIAFACPQTRDFSCSNVYQHCTASQTYRGVCVGF